MIKLNHTIVYAHDKRASSTFLADLFGLQAPVPFGPFLTVEVDNEVTLDYHDAEGDIAKQHYAFLVSDDAFDAIFERIGARGMPYWADPRHGQPSQINTRDGGRGVYFDDPDGHVLEIITTPYGVAR
ncbi:MAG: VOC family protein [Candidatus Limnocylindria bacterium]